MSFKDINKLTASAHQRKPSLTSSIDSSDESVSSSTKNAYFGDSLEEIEKSYIFVTLSKENVLLVEDGINWSKRGSLSSIDMTCSESDE